MFDSKRRHGQSKFLIGEESDQQCEHCRTMNGYKEEKENKIILHQLLPSSPSAGILNGILAFLRSLNVTHAPRSRWLTSISWSLLNKPRYQREFQLSWTCVFPKLYYSTYKSISIKMTSNSVQRLKCKRWLTSILLICASDAIYGGKGGVNLNPIPQDKLTKCFQRVCASKALGGSNENAYMRHWHCMR